MVTCTGAPGLFVKGEIDEWRWFKKQRGFDTIHRGPIFQPHIWDHGETFHSSVFGDYHLYKHYRFLAILNKYIPFVRRFWKYTIRFNTPDFLDMPVHVRKLDTKPTSNKWEDKKSSIDNNKWPYFKGGQPFPNHHFGYPFVSFRECNFKAKNTACKTCRVAMGTKAQMNSNIGTNLKNIWKTLQFATKFTSIIQSSKTILSNLVNSTVSFRVETIVKYLDKGNPFKT